MRRGEDDYLVIKHVQPFASNCSYKYGMTFNELVESEILNEEDIIQVIDKKIKTIILIHL